MTDPARRDFLKISAALAAAGATGGISPLFLGNVRAAEVRVKPPPVKPLRRAQSTTIEFTEGVPARISVASLLPAGADRYHGGWEVQVGGSTPNSALNYLPGVNFDAATRSITYDGSPLSANPEALTPNPGYYIGYEGVPYNPHWQFPPTQLIPPAPKAIGGEYISQSIYGGSKHTRFVYCDWDGKVYNMGGDYSAYGYPTLRGGGDGRMAWWRFDPRDGTWDNYYPMWGKAGEQVPLMPDRMNWDWDADRQIFWLNHGSPRMGPYGYFCNNVASLAPGNSDTKQAWKGEGGIADAVPERITDDALPTLIFDPKTQSMRYACATPILNAPWLQSWNTFMQASAYHRASKRWYALATDANGNIMVCWLDTTPFDSDPTKLAWQTATVDTSKVAPPMKNPYNVGRSTPHCVDEQAALIYMFHGGDNQAIYGLTLPGHPLREHNIVQVADLSTAIGYNMSSAPSGTGMGTESPFIFIPEHRVLVLMIEPSEEEVGPYSRSLEINVDTGAVMEGPRFPNSDIDGLPWFPNAGFWYPPTQELILYGIAIMNHNRVGGNRSWDKPTGNLPTAMLRYKRS